MKRSLTLLCLTTSLMLGACNDEAIVPPVGPDWGFVSATLANNCNPCHTSMSSFPNATDPMTGLDDPDNAYDMIVGHPAQQADMNRVTPGDPENSYLLHKIRGTHLNAGGAEGRMPDGGPYLDEETLDAIEMWIAAGASQEITSDDDDSADDDDDDSADDDDVSDDDDDSAAPSFTQVWTEILSQNCSCHNIGAGGWAHEGERETAYGILVGVTSGQATPMNRIEPGDPTQSYLMHKLDGTHESAGGSGLRMPRSGPPYLSDSDRDTIRGWITAGAQNN